MDTLQLSHEELLLLLSIYRLPMPVAMGEDPTEGYNERALEAAMTSALGSLAARGVISMSDGTTAQPHAADGIEALLADTALANACLAVTGTQGETEFAVYYTMREDAVIAHTSPLERVHRLERLTSAAHIVEQLLAVIGPHLPTEESMTFSVDAGALHNAIDASTASQAPAARALLRAAGVSSALVDAFVGKLGSETARYAVVAIQQLQAPEPSVESWIVLQGAQETWCIEALPTDEERVSVQTVTPEALRQRFVATLDLLMQHEHASATSA